MTNKIDNKKSVATRAGGMITGMRKHYPTGSQTITVGNETITIDAAVANLQAIADNRAAVTTARAAAKVTVANENAKLPPLVKFMTALVAFVRGVYGNDATALADFDLEPLRTRKPMTAEQKAVAAVKRNATREARGEVSAEKRKALKGNVTAQLVVTAAAPPAPEPVAPPAAGGQTTPNKG
jgi:hypothetical protein